MRQISITKSLFNKIFGRLRHFGGFDAGNNSLYKQGVGIIFLQELCCQLNTYILMAVCIAAAETCVMKPGRDIQNKTIFVAELVVISYFFTSRCHPLCMFKIMKPDAFINFILKKISYKGLGI